MPTPHIRAKALSTVLDRRPRHSEAPSARISEFFGSSVFNEEAMRMFLTEDAYYAVRQAIHLGSRIDRKLADQVASGMKEWAASEGATHYTHWFQPLSGTSAEKHDAFGLGQQPRSGLFRTLFRGRLPGNGCSLWRA